MSDHSISIVPKISSYPDNLIKAKEVLNWLIGEDIVKPSLTDCVLSKDYGYAISNGARFVSNQPNELPFNFKVNGLEVITTRRIIHTGENGMYECICPNCHENIAEEDWSFFNEWFEQRSDNIICPKCKVATNIHQFKFSPEWGFCNLGFTFWNWSDLNHSFINEFKIKLECDISVVYTHI